MTDTSDQNSPRDPNHDTSRDPNHDAPPDIWHTDPRVPTLNTWIMQAGLTGQPSPAILESYCLKLVEMGVPLMRTHVTINALHPIYGSMGFDWQRHRGSAQHTYDYVSQSPDNWLKSPFHHMLSSGLATYREKLFENTAPSRFPLLAKMKPQGATDYLAMGVLFSAMAPGTQINADDRLEGALMSWMSDAPAGFCDADIALIEATFPGLSLALRANSNRQTAVDLLGVYLGRDAGARVLSGELQRGSTQWIDAVICYFDLEGFTGMSQQIEGEALIALLNDYFGLVVTRIEAQGGNVLKFMGDGLLAIFDRDGFADAADRAVAAVRALQADMAARSAARLAQDLPTLGYTIALHAGPVLYGNIGADERLDFTVIGPEVNLAARIGGMHRALGQKVILSHTVTQDVRTTDVELVSLGRYMLRGVDRPQELFTIFEEAP